MRPLQIHSEGYSPTGNIEALGALNQLGRPKLDQLTVLVREAFQNSWDARLKDHGVVCAMDLWTASPDQKAVLQKTVFAEPAPKVGFESLFRNDVALLAISDRGTQGLGGPSRADLLPEPGESSDFIDLLRNLGQPPDKPLGGGTFGYGKAALYAPSAVNTIVVYTRARVFGKLVSRLIGACLGTGFAVNTGPSRGRYTGRHWWGRLSDGIAEPVVGEEADALASAIGLSPFSPQETGTTILIVGFRSSIGHDLRVAAEALRSAILWNLWPKMLASRDGKTPMTFRMTLEGESFTVPSPKETAPLALFSKALQLARSQQAVRDSETVVMEITATTKGTSKALGWLALVKGMREGRPQGLMEDASVGGVDARNVSHVACMRAAELVVKYLPGPPLEHDLREYAGVFVVAADKSVDQLFSTTEPPTHDDWVPPPRQRSPVRSAFKTIVETATSFAQPQGSRRDSTEQVPLGRLSSLLGGILVGLPGRGGESASVEDERARSAPTIEIDPAPEDSDESEEDVSLPPANPRDEGGERSPDGSGGDSGGGKSGSVPHRSPGRPAVRMAQPRLAVEDEDVGVLQVDVDVRHGVRTPGTRLRVSFTVLLDGGVSEDAPPAGGAMPVVYRWRGAGRVLDLPGDTLDLGPGDAGRWTLSVRLIDDAEIRVSVTGEALP